MRYLPTCVSFPALYGMNVAIYVCNRNITKILAAGCVLAFLYVILK